MLKILIQDSVKLEGLSYAKIQEIKGLLTITNPLFLQRLELSLANWGVPKNLTFYKQEGDILHIPIGAFSLLVKEKIISPTKDQVVDNRTSRNDLYKFNLIFKGVLRNYQQSIVDSCMPRTAGVIEAMTGSGKTVSFIKLILEKQVNTIIMVNTIELINQTRKAIIQYTNYPEDEVGIIGDSKYIIKPITIATHQSLWNLTDEKIEEINNSFGMIIADECHLIPAQNIFNIMQRLSIKNRFGFSATINGRSDKLDKVIFFALGSHLYTVPAAALKNVLIKPTFEIIETDYYFPLLDMQDYQNLITDLCLDYERNGLILDTVKTYKDNYVLLLCGRVEQVEYLTKKLGDTAIALTAQVSKKQRKIIMQDILNKKYNYIVSTYNLFSTGIDVPHLDILVLCSPIKSEIKLRQSAGRLMRKSDGKSSALIVDFVDPKVSLLKSHAYKRKKLLENL